MGVDQSRATELVRDTCDAHSLLSEYQYLVERAQYQEAIPYALQAVEKYRKHQLWERYIMTYIQLSELSDHLGAASKAKYAQQALDYSNKYLEEGHVLIAKAYRQQGEALMYYEKYDSANYYFSIAIHIFQEHQEWENIAWSKILTAVSHYYLNNIKAGQAELEGPFWQNPSLNDNVLSSLYDLQGVYYSVSGDLDKAISSTVNAMELTLDNPNKKAVDSSQVVSHLNNLGKFYEQKGDYQRATDYFKQASSLLSTFNSEIESLIIINNNVGKTLIFRRLYQEAIPYFRQSERLIKQMEEPGTFTDDLEEVYHNLGVIYNETNQYDSAAYYLEKNKALPQLQSTAPNLSLGNLYMRLAQPECALAYYEQAIRNTKDLKYDAPTYLSRTYFRIGEVYANAGDYEQALPYYQKSLVINYSSFTDSTDFYKNPDQQGIILKRPDFIETLKAKANALSKLSGQVSDLEAGLSTYLLTIQWADSLKKDNVLEGNALYWSKQNKEIYEGAISTAYRLYQKTNKEVYLHTAFEIAEKSKSTLLLEAFSTKTGIKNTNVPVALLQRERDLSIDIAYHQKSLAEAIEKQDSSKIELHQEYLRDSRLELAQLKENMEQDYADFYQLKYGNKALDLDKVRQDLLDEESALIEYFIGQQQAYAFVLSKATVQLIQLPAPDSIRHAMAQLKTQLFQTKAFRLNPQEAFLSFNRAAFQAYQAVLADAIAGLPSNIKQLLIVPDGLLNTMPFEVLNTRLESEPTRDFSKLPYLVYPYTIHYGYSIKLLLKNRERHQQLEPNTNCLAFAPAYESNEPVAALDMRSNQLRNGIAALDNTADEIEGISHHFDGLFIDTWEATKTNFVQDVADYGILHLAMHGEADFNNPNFGHLIFSNIGVGATEESLLYHYEIANLNLNAQLAVLSACETGVGKYEEGEGVFSLARSFMYAGVPSIVMSLWKVNDKSTSQIMPYFYSQLSARQNKSQALRNAKLQYLEEASLENRHPFYWAGFVALGDQQALKRPFPGPFTTGLAVVALLAFLGGWFWFSKR